MKQRMTRQQILAAIDAERQRQDVKWGGPEHDEGHSPYDWCRMLRKHVADARKQAGSVSGLTTEMVQIAALAVAGIEAAQRIGNVPVLVDIPDDIYTALEDAADDHELSIADYIGALLHDAAAPLMEVRR